jgi:hypothetical protein
MVEMSVRQGDCLQEQSAASDKIDKLGRFFARVDADCISRLRASDNARVLLERR